MEIQLWYKSLSGSLALENANKRKLVSFYKLWEQFPDYLDSLPGMIGDA